MSLDHRRRCFVAHLDSLALPNHRPLSSNVMSDAVEMTYLDLSKRRAQQHPSAATPTNTSEASVVPKPKPKPVDDAQQPLTTQSTFTEITELATSKESQKIKQSRKVSTTTNDTARKTSCTRSVTQRRVCSRSTRAGHSCLHLARSTDSFLLWQSPR